MPFGIKMWYLPISVTSTHRSLLPTSVAGPSLVGVKQLHGEPAMWESKFFLSEVNIQQMGSSRQRQSGQVWEAIMVGRLKMSSPVGQNTQTCSGNAYNSFLIVLSFLKLCLRSGKTAGKSAYWTNMATWVQILGTPIKNKAWPGAFITFRAWG